MHKCMVIWEADALQLVSQMPSHFLLLNGGALGVTQEALHDGAVQAAALQPLQIPRSMIFPNHGGLAPTLCRTMVGET
jgi:hypothetical protein